MLCTHRTFETFVGNMEVQDPDEPTIPFLVYVWLTEYYIYIYYIYIYTCTLPPHMLCTHSSQIAQLDQQPSGLMDAGSDHGSAAKGSAIHLEVAGSVLVGCCFSIPSSFLTRQTVSSITIERR